MNKIALIGIFISSSAFASFDGSSSFGQGVVRPAALAPISISVTSTSSQGIAANPLRTGLSCTNIGGANVSIAFGAYTAVNSAGITLAPLMAYWFDPMSYSYGAMNVISPTSSTLSCQEFN